MTKKKLFDQDGDAVGAEPREIKPGEIVVGKVLGWTDSKIAIPPMELIVALVRQRAREEKERGR